MTTEGAPFTGRILCTVFETFYIKFRGKITADGFNVTEKCQGFGSNSWRGFLSVALKSLIGYTLRELCLSPHLANAIISPKLILTDILFHSI